MLSPSSPAGETPTSPTSRPAGNAHHCDPPTAERCTLRYGLGWPQKQIARHERASESTTSERIARGVGCIVAKLNGESPADDEPVMLA